MWVCLREGHFIQKVTDGWSVEDLPPPYFFQLFVLLPFILITMLCWFRERCVPLGMLDSPHLPHMLLFLPSLSLTHTHTPTHEIREQCATTKMVLFPLRGCYTALAIWAPSRQWINHQRTHTHPHSHQSCTSKCGWWIIKKNN